MTQFAQKILVPTDFSASTERALKTATLLAEQNGSSVALIHILDPSPLAVGGAGLGTVGEPELEPELEARIHEELSRLCTKHLEKVPRVKTALILSKNAADGIVQYAEKEACDLIVMPTHGRSGLAHLLIGSVAEKVVRHASCPVLTLRDLVSS